MADGRPFCRAEKSHQEGSEQGYVLAENSLVIKVRNRLKHWTFQCFYGIISTVKSD